MRIFDISNLSNRDLIWGILGILNQLKWSSSEMLLTLNTTIWISEVQKFTSFHYQPNSHSKAQQDTKAAGAACLSGLNLDLPA